MRANILSAALLLSLGRAAPHDAADGSCEAACPQGGPSAPAALSPRFLAQVSEPSSAVAFTLECELWKHARVVTSCALEALWGLRDDVARAGGGTGGTDDYISEAELAPDEEELNRCVYNRGAMWLQPGNFTGGPEVWGDALAYDAPPGKGWFAMRDFLDAVGRFEAATRNERESFWFGGPDLQNTFLHGVAAGDGTEADPFRLLWGDRPVQPTEATNRTGYI